MRQKIDRQKTKKYEKMFRGPKKRNIFMSLHEQMTESCLKHHPGIQNETRDGDGY